MRFTPKSEKEINEANLLPPGEYDFTVTRAEDTKSKKTSADMIKVTLGVYRQDGTMRLVDDYLMEALAYKLRHFCEAVGVTAQYEEGTLHAEELEGRSGKVKLVIQEQENYPAKNSVKDYVVPKKQNDQKPLPSFVNKPLPNEEDDIPNL